MESTDKSQEAQQTEAVSERVELSEREREILVLVATGLSNKEIAQRLVISPNTVKVHLRNIFAKIDVSSRTEAALFAIREGLVQGMGETTAAVAGSASLGPNGDAPPLPTLPTLLAPAPARPRRWLPLGVIVLVALLAGAGILWYLRIQPTTAPQATAAPRTPIPRWTVHADLPTARTGLAVVAFDNDIYAIGGEANGIVTGALERYDPSTGAWRVLAPKPEAVADAGAAVIGGEIFVPGGRLAGGVITNTLAVYDPRLNQWSTRAPMPKAISAYSLATFEGRLVVLGGWDGQRYGNWVYSYDPGTDAWTEQTPMPTARGFAGAAAAAGHIYVMGGTDGSQDLAVNEFYQPPAEGTGAGIVWQTAKPMPAGRSHMGITGLADYIYVVGGQTGKGSSAAIPLVYFPRRDEWQTADMPPISDWSGLGLVASETSLYAIGGQVSGVPGNYLAVYQALYTVLFPAER
jgi:DNA-binding CsgD family transcriptional regulator